MFLFIVTAMTFSWPEQTTVPLVQIRKLLEKMISERFQMELMVKMKT